MTRRTRGVPGAGAVVAAVGLGVLSLVAIAVVGMSVGPAALPGAAALALVPLVAIAAAVRWVDRWEPEPWPALAVAFGWGASVSVLVALVLNTGAITVLTALGSDVVEASAVGATVVAPVVEESIKALGVVIVLLAWRREFDGPVDGLVYAATVAAGFAFVENILYFGATISGTAGLDGSEAAVATVFVLRAVVSPFAHLLFTACVGLALGLASRSGSRAAWAAALPVGLVAAIGLHALWNGTAVSATTGGFVAMYLTVQVPIFLGAVGLVVWLRRVEAHVVRDRLGEYAHAGVVVAADVPMLASLGLRRRARAWAGARGGRPAAAAMTDYQQAATALAYHAQRVRRHRTVEDAAHEHALVRALDASRRRLLTAVAV